MRMPLVHTGHNDRNNALALHDERLHWARGRGTTCSGVQRAAAQSAGSCRSHAGGNKADSRHHRRAAAQRRAVQSPATPTPPLHCFGSLGPHRPLLRCGCCKWERVISERFGMAGRCWRPRASRRSRNVMQPRRGAPRVVQWPPDRVRTRSHRRPRRRLWRRFSARARALSRSVDPGRCPRQGQLSGTELARRQERQPSSPPQHGAQSRKWHSTGRVWRSLYFGEGWAELSELGHAARRLFCVSIAAETELPPEGVRKRTAGPGKS